MRPLGPEVHPGPWPAQKRGLSHKPEAPEPANARASPGADGPRNPARPQAAAGRQLARETPGRRPVRPRQRGEGGQHWRKLPGRRSPVTARAEHECTQEARAAAAPLPAELAPQHTAQVPRRRPGRDASQSPGSGDASVCGPARRCEGPGPGRGQRLPSVHLSTPEFLEQCYIPVLYM